MHRLRAFAKEAAWTVGPPLVAALLTGVLWSCGTERLTSTHCEASATGESCGGNGCIPISRGEWELAGLEHKYAGRWMPVVLLGFLSVGSAVVRWLTALYELVTRRAPP